MLAAIKGRSSRGIVLALAAFLPSLPVFAAGQGFHAGEVRVTRPASASESAIAIDPVDPQKIVAGTIGPGQEVRMHFSTDGGQSWVQSELPLGFTQSHPSVGWSADGRFAYAAALGHCVDLRCNLFFYRSADGGATWDDLEQATPGYPRRTLSQAADRPVLHADLAPGSPYRDRIYLAYHESNVIHLVRSSDFGNTWAGVRFSPAGPELGAGADVATNRAGEVFVAWPGMNSRTIRLRKSVDGGQTFATSVAVAATQSGYRFAVPAQELRGVRLYVSAAADKGTGPFGGSLYLAWADTAAPAVFDPVLNHARVQVAFSRDGGATWSVTTPHPTADLLEVDRWNPFLAAGADGTVHVVFYDTRHSPDRTGVDLYYAFSTDGAQTWSTSRRVTAVTSPHIEDPYQFGDYNGLDIVLNRLIAGYTDNRNEAGVAEDSTDVYAAEIAAGGSLPAAGRLLGSEGAPGPPLLVSKNADGTRLDLAWAGACGPAQDFAVYEGALGSPESTAPLLCSTGGATSATIVPSPAQRFYLVVPAVTGAEGSYGRLTGGAERPPAAAPCLPQSIGACP